MCKSFDSIRVSLLMRHSPRRGLKTMEWMSNVDEDEDENEREPRMFISYRYDMLVHITVNFHVSILVLFHCLVVPECWLTL